MSLFKSAGRTEYSRILKIAIPVALSQLGHIAVGVADSVMVGRLGGEALAAVTVAFSIQIPFMMFGIGISYGISPMIAKADGENNAGEISRVFKHGLLLNLFTGLLLFLLLFFGSPLTRYLDQPERVVERAIPFFELLAISMIPLMIFQSFRQFAEGLGQTRQAMWISISGNLINIGLNYLLIYGHFGFPAFGIAGAGIATLSARIYLAVAMGTYIMFANRFNKYVRNFGSYKIEYGIFRRIFTLTLPVGMQMTLESGAFGFAAIMVGWLGADEISAHHVALNMAAITYMAATGIASASTVRVGNEFGKKDLKALRNAGFASFHVVLIFMSLAAVFFLLFRHSLPALYIKETNIEQMAISLLLITAFFQLSDGLQAVALGALRGIADVKIPTAIALISYWGVGLPIGYFFAFKLGQGVEGIWYGLLIGLTVAATLLFFRFRERTSKMSL